MEDQKQNLSGILLKVAWMSILLGVGMELILVAIAAGFGKNPQVKVLMADMVQKISWASFLCMGIALGTATARSEIPRMGLLGMVSGPVAFFAAKALHKGATEALAIAAPTSGMPSPFVMALIKSLEYGSLGMLFAYLGRFPEAGLRAHALTGFAIGLVFGGLVLYLMITQTAATIPFLNMLSRGVNEIIFPVGCSVVLYSAKRLKI